MGCVWNNCHDKPRDLDLLRYVAWTASLSELQVQAVLLISLADRERLPALKYARAFYLYEAKCTCIISTMNEEQAKLWVKDKENQKRVIEACIGQDPRADKLAFFMAGIPGAGKTEFAKGLQGSPLGDYIVIEHDQLVEYIDGYKPENYYDFRKAGSTLVTKLFDHCLKNGYSFIFDGTLSHDNGYKNIKKTLDHGYSVIVLYVHQDIKSAWRLTQDRELVKKRAIERSGFIDTCQRITLSLRKIFTAFQGNQHFAFWIVKKNGAPGTENSELILYDYLDDASDKSTVEQILNEDYNISELEGL